MMGLKYLIIFCTLFLSSIAFGQEMETPPGDMDPFPYESNCPDENLLDQGEDCNEFTWHLIDSEDKNLYCSKCPNSNIIVRNKDYYGIGNHFCTPSYCPSSCPYNSNYDAINSFWNDVINVVPDLLTSSSTTTDASTSSETDSNTPTDMDSDAYSDMDSNTPIDMYFDTLMDMYSNMPTDMYTSAFGTAPPSGGGGSLSKGRPSKEMLNGCRKQMRCPRRANTEDGCWGRACLAMECVLGECNRAGLDCSDQCKFILIRHNCDQAGYNFHVALICSGGGETDEEDKMDTIIDPSCDASNPYEWMKRFRRPYTIISDPDGDIDISIGNDPEPGTCVITFRELPMPSLDGWKCPEKGTEKHKCLTDYIGCLNKGGSVWGDCRPKYDSCIKLVADE